MKTKFLSILKISKILTVIAVIFLLLTSCTNTNNDNDVIQLWWYDYDNSGYYREIMEHVTIKIMAYCKVNDIPLKIVKYNERKISYDDYVLKRNTAMATGNVIVIDDARKLADISKQHYDYSKIERYNNLFDMYKDRYCIPLGVGYMYLSVKNDLFNYYGVKPDKEIITYREYLDIKREARDKGARFKFNKMEWEEIIDYNLLKNEIYKIGDKSEIIDDENRFKDAVKSSVIGVYDDYKLYYSSYSDIDSLDDTSGSMYDINSKIDLMVGASSSFLTRYAGYYPFREHEYDKTFVLMPDYTQLSPCVYISKKITDERVLDIINDTLSISYYKTFVFIVEDGRITPAPWFSPTSDTSEMKRYAEVDDNWRYEGKYMMYVSRGQEGYIKTVDRINEAYDILYKNGEESIKNADYYFSNEAYNELIKSSVRDLAKELISEELDYNDKNVDKMLNKKINEIIMNFYVHFD